MVVEHGGNCVSIFNSAGEKIQSFGSGGSGNGEFYKPCGVAIDEDGNILVVDKDNYRIQKFSSDGKFIAAVGAKGSCPLQFRLPVGIKINPHTKMVYVADQGNSRVQVLRPYLTYSNMFGCVMMPNPSDVAFDSANNVYVCESNGMKVYTKGENLIRQIDPGYHWDMIAIDNEDKVYKTSYSSHRISVFTSDGDYLTSFGSEGNGPQQLKYPRGLAVDESGMVYVSDSGNDRVQIF